MIILGLDPGLGTTGWGVIRKEGNRLSHVDNGEIETDAKLPLANRLVLLDEKLHAVLDHFRPDYAAVEEVFVNKTRNQRSSLDRHAAWCCWGLRATARQSPNMPHGS